MADLAGLQMPGGFEAINLRNDSANYERGVFTFQVDANTLRIGTENAGTGVARGIKWVYGGTQFMDYGVTNTNGLTLASGNFLFESAAIAITAGTTRTQAGATPLAQEINRVDTSTAPAAGSLLGDGVVLPALLKGMTLLVWNNTANPIQLYAAGASTVNGVAGATGISMPPNSLYLAIGAANADGWMVDGTGMGNAGQYPTESAIDNLTAHAGGGQGSATALPALFNRVTTVATAADSSILPASKAGMNITVTNAAATNSMNVFPATGEAINALGSNTAFALAAGKTATFYCYTAGQWHSILSA